MRADATKCGKKDAERVRSCFARATEKIIQNCTAAHSAVGAGNSVRADATKCGKKRRGACSVVFCEGDDVFGYFSQSCQARTVEDEKFGEFVSC